MLGIVAAIGIFVAMVWAHAVTGVNPLLTLGGLANLGLVRAEEG